MQKLVEKFDRAFYPGHGSNWDDALFRTFVLKRISPESTILDFGAGAGIVVHMNFRGLAKRVCGVDLDPRVLDNRMLDEGKPTDGRAIPYADGTFDLVFSDNVLEHVQNPIVSFCEINRVLKPNGVFAFKTPNKWHYMPLIARLTPLTFHRFVNRLRGRAPADTFPTSYRANSRGRLLSLAKASGFVIEDLSFEEGRPEYLRFSWPTYLLGAAYERIVNSASVFEPLRIVIIGAMRKL